MFPLRCSKLLCVQLRTFSKTIPRLDRFSRDSLRNRIYKQNIKDLAKQNIQAPGPSTLPYAGDVVALRPSRDLWKALGFTAFVGVTSFTLAVVSDLERTRKLPKTLQQAATNFFNETFRGVPDNENNLTWKQLSAGEKNCFYLVGANLLVFVLWRVKALQPFMWRYFTNSFASRSLCLPMLLSAFSHSNLLHFGLNMYVVYSFASLAADKFLGVDQFWGFYCVAAVVSSLASLLHKSAVRSSVRALGASGAILALLTYTCMKMPDARLKIVFVPFFDFSAQAAVFGILLFDLCGLVFKFRLFDHAAHLGGALFGVFYALLGEHFIWQHYGNLVEEYYRKIRKE